MITVVLPWPAGELFPNAARRLHWAAKANAARDARLWAQCVTREAAQAMAVTVPDGRIPVRFVFHPPDRRKRDSDGLLAAMKPARDGIADALGADDSRFWPLTVELGGVVTGGKVVVQIGA